MPKPTLPPETSATKTAAQLAYEADVSRCPLYHDGSPRVGWDRLSAVARWSWERNPTPRDHSAGHPTGDDRDTGWRWSADEWKARKQEVRS